MASSMTYQNAVNILLRRVPAFAVARAQDESYMSHDDDSPYLVFGDFGRFLKYLLKYESDASKSASTLTEAFKLLGEMVTSTDDEVANLAEVGVFEVLTDSPESITAARQYLSGKALDIFERVVNVWTPTSDHAR